MSSAICFNLDQSKMLSSGKGLKVSARRLFWFRFIILRKRPTCRKTVCAVLVLFAEFTALLPEIFPGLESQRARQDLGGATGIAGILWPLCFCLGYVSVFK